MAWRLIPGDCVGAMAAMDDASVDAVVTDPPYGIGFMGHEWDQPGVEHRAGPGEWDQPPAPGRSAPRSQGSMEAGKYDLRRPALAAFQAWSEQWAREAFRVLKPGGHLIAFAGTRTYHRMVCGVEDAGFEIRDQLAWLFGSGFPKSLDVAKAIDRAAGAEREVIAARQEHDITRPVGGGHERLMTSAGAPSTPDAERWEGWGTALKPAHEPIVLARKPLVGTVAANVLEHGTGALNVDGCRIKGQSWGERAPNRGGRSGDIVGAGIEHPGGEANALGRWPANVALDEHAAAMLDEQTGTLQTGAWNGSRSAPKTKNAYGAFDLQDEHGRPADSGGASRFLYVAKASRAERNAGLDGLPRSADRATVTPTSTIHKGRSGGRIVDDREYSAPERVNVHPTVKPIELMRWLVRMVTPPGGLVLDPFVGSGTTGCGAVLEGFEFVGIERDEDYLPIAEARIKFWADQPQGIETKQAIAAAGAREKVADAGQGTLL